MKKTIGIVGGMTPESTTMYYEHMIRSYQNKYDDYDFPEIIIDSVSFQNYVDWMDQERWDHIAAGLIKAVRNLEKAGADFAVIATNTMHHVFTEIEKNTTIPLISIVDATADAIRQQGLTTVGLLGTRFTMQKKFYQERMDPYKIKLMVPEEKDQDIVHSVIFNELGKGIINEASRKKYLRIIDKLKQDGCQGIILGCTEIPLLIKDEDCDLPLFNTSILHAESALAYALSD